MEVESLEDRQMLSAVDIYAAGSTGEEIMQVLVNDEVAETFVVGGDFDNREFEKFSLQLQDDISADDIGIRFTNDAWNPSIGLDRNLLVDKVIVDGVTYHSEHYSSNISALWLNGGIQSGNLQTEILNVNGQIDYSSSGAQQFNQLDINARGDTGDEILELLIDDQLVSQWQLGTDFQTFNYVSNNDIAIESIKVRFSNDAYLPASGYDSNVTVGSLRFFDLQSTDTITVFGNESSVYSTGTWLEADGVVAGYGRGNILHANGFLDFSQVNDNVLDEADIVVKWNKVLNEILIADDKQQNPGYASRSMAILNLAIHDAVAAANGSDTFYSYDSLPTGNVDAKLAASHAAYLVLESLYSSQTSLLDQYWSYITGGVQDAASLALGDAIGNQIMSKRANDGWDSTVGYQYGDGPGAFKADPLNPDVPAWGPAWGSVDTFAISSAASYLPATTPPLDSAQYAASYNEVKELGSVNSSTRTADQLEAGIFWAYDRVGLGTPMTLFSSVLETVSSQENNSFADNVKLYAQASVALADAGIVAWQSKFDEEFWRPVTAIRDGDIDGNDLTIGDASWTAIGAPDGSGNVVGFTPPFPTYISGHATFGAALFGTLQNFYGTDDISFTLESRELEILIADPALESQYGLNLDDAKRTFNSFSEAQIENGRSRVYLGIHFDFDDLIGQEVGQAVAASVVSDFVAAEDQTLTVRAYGSEPGALFNILVDGDILASFEATTSSSDFEFSLPRYLDPAVIQIEFTNDEYVEGSFDRNLIVEYIQVGDVQYQIDSIDVFSTGTWTAQDGIVDGFGRGNALHINGYFLINV